MGMEARVSANGSLVARYPQEETLDRDTVRRWRSEAITAPAQDRLWLAETPDGEIRDYSDHPDYPESS
jgi:uncharacterized membrane-anchored protein